MATLGPVGIAAAAAAGWVASYVPVFVEFVRTNPEAAAGIAAIFAAAAGYAGYYMWGR